MFLNDQETATDLLYYEAIASTVVKLIRETQQAPITIGVHGDWGAGKSSVLKMTQAAFQDDGDVLCLWFNGWTFEGFEDAKTVIIENVIEDLRRARPASDKVADAARKVFKRLDWLKMARKAGGFAMNMAGLPNFDQLKGFYDLAVSVVSDPAEHLDQKTLAGLTEKAGEFLKDAEADGDHVPSHMHAFREEFKALLDAADIKQLVVIVDDLDRCLPNTAIATLEAIRLFLFVERTAFVIGADEMMIEYAVREHFPDLPPSSGSVSYARNYLEKLIQVPFRIPALGVAETRNYISLLLAEDALGADNPDFQALLASAREDMRRPWISRGLDRAAVETALKGKVTPAVEQALLLSGYVTEPLAKGTRGNPRQIKRFLNSMMLRHEIAEARGFGSDIQRPVLAKMMLAERFQPDLYEQIAHLVASSSSGRVRALELLEAAVRQSESAEEAVAGDEGNAGRKKASKDKPQKETADWLGNDWVSRWALLEPRLGELDLRPYVFITRDKRSALGAYNTDSHLEGLVEKLMGPRALMKGGGITEQVGALSVSDSQEVFEMLRARIFQADSFEDEPSGVQGMIHLVLQHQFLQRRLLDLIRTFEVSKLGAWAASCWDECIKDDAHAKELTTILKEWSVSPDNQTLASTANVILKVRGK
ncbi:Qat anti-phage system ATPase QatA [Pseudomonas sp. CR3202]|uniref:Qat anti-phage system ATPase QatA n=1 Tax=Pseudomonas sp. CR3202 TaxID=3351532 RepID=UPI003BF0010D